MPILRSHADRYSTNVASLSNQSAREPRGYTVRRSSKCEIPCLGRRWTAVKNLTLLALSSAEKSVIVQTNKQTHTQAYTQTHKQTVNNISTLYPSACMDKKLCGNQWLDLKAESGWWNRGWLLGETTSCLLTEKAGEHDKFPQQSRGEPWPPKGFLKSKAFNKWIK